MRVQCIINSAARHTVFFAPVITVVALCVRGNRADNAGQFMSPNGERLRSIEHAHANIKSTAELGVTLRAHYGCGNDRVRTSDSTPWNLTAVAY